MISNGRLIQEDDNNETRALCFKCIALLLEALKFEEAQKLNARISDMLAVPPPTARMEASPHKFEARSVPPMTRKVDFLGQLKYDWLSWEMAILFCWQFVLLFVLPAFGHVLPICMGQNILVNESIFFICHSFCFS
jgi:hypothetical protein